MQTFYKIISWLLSALGLVHIIFTFVFYNSFSLDALWFVGAGLSLVFLGQLNLAAIKANLPSIYTMSIVANLISIVFFSLVVIALPEPQACLGLVLAIGALAGSIYQNIKIKT